MSKKGSCDISFRRTKKNKRKNTFNKYGKNTSRGLRIKAAALEAKERNIKMNEKKSGGGKKSGNGKKIGGRTGKGRRNGKGNGKKSNN